MNFADMSLILVYGSMAALTVGMVAFAIDIFNLAADTATPSRKAAGIGVSTTWLGFGLLAGGLVARAVAAGRVPWANMYEFTLMAAFFAIGIFLVLNLNRDVRYLGVVVNLVSLLGLGIATSVLYVKAEGVEPILDHYWLIIHVSVATISVGLLYMGSALALAQLAQHAAEKRGAGIAAGAVQNRATASVSAAVADDIAARAEATGGGVATLTGIIEDTGSDAVSDTGSGVGSDEESKFMAGFVRVMSHLPSSATLELLAYRVVGVGFVAWTFTVIAGAIWAEHAWGRPWGWDPKETWSFVVWVIYAAYLHARATVGWTAEKFAYFLIVGFLALLANFYLVNLFIPGNHSYAY